MKQQLPTITIEEEVTQEEKARRIQEYVKDGHELLSYWGITGRRCDVYSNCENCITLWTNTMIHARHHMDLIMKLEEGKSLSWTQLYNIHSNFVNKRLTEGGKCYPCTNKQKK